MIKPNDSITLDISQSTKRIRSRNMSVHTTCNGRLVGSNRSSNEEYEKLVLEIISIILI